MQATPRWMQGGNRYELQQRLKEVEEYAHAHPTLDKKQLMAWIEDNFQVSSNTARNYLNTVCRRLREKEPDAPERPREQAEDE
jgi:hypothetical protein